MSGSSQADWLLFPDNYLKFGPNVGSVLHYFATAALATLGVFAEVNVFANSETIGGDSVDVSHRSDLIPVPFRRPAAQWCGSQRCSRGSSTAALARRWSAGDGDTEAEAVGDLGGASPCRRRRSEVKPQKQPWTGLAKAIAGPEPPEACRDDSPRRSPRRSGWHGCGSRRKYDAGVAESEQGGATCRPGNRHLQKR